MSLWVIVPVKPFAQGKSRLDGHISAQERQNFNRGLLRQTLQTIRQARVATGIIVVSRDPAALALAEQEGACPLAEATLPAPEPEARLNQALSQASDYAIARQASALLVLPTDLPRLTTQDVQRAGLPTGKGPMVTVAPSGDGGTNALYLRPPGVIPFCFGPDSSRRHQMLAEEAGLPVRVVRSATLAFDVDWPADYARAWEPQAER